MSKRSGSGAGRSYRRYGFIKTQIATMKAERRWWTGNGEPENGPVKELTQSEIKALEKTLESVGADRWGS